MNSDSHATQTNLQLNNALHLIVATAFKVDKFLPFHCLLRQQTKKLFIRLVINVMQFVR